MAKKALSRIASGVRMIDQVHISASLSDFPWDKAYGCRPYYDSLKPCLFIGVYREEDIRAILNHQSIAVVAWCGSDSLSIDDLSIFDKSNIHHVSFMPNVNQMINFFKPCSLVPYPYFKDEAKPMPLGDKVFVYLPNGHPTYHGLETFNQLKALMLPNEFEFIIGDGSIDQEEWRSGRCDDFYSQCFAGLVLSRYAGGGSTIIELGMRGRMCVTNTLNMPNTISWASAKEALISLRKLRNDFSDDKASLLSKSMKTHLDRKRTILDLSYYE